MATSAALSRVLVEKQKLAGQTVRKWPEETPVEQDIEEFTLAERDAVLKNTKNSTRGEDGVPPLLLKNSPENGKLMLLRLQQELERGPSADSLEKGYNHPDFETWEIPSGNQKPQTSFTTELYLENSGSTCHEKVEKMGG